ncbi:DUF1853 family protein [Neisseria weaveri]|uniref:DUF1853 family protein n=1 Tax=Neisseria weaveri TaxID=28091 RepID=UPI000D302EB6|nr:DUF1853 family protein [Neisseria weaveri]
MNYALDALWWRLTDPSVRDLAAILTAPPLWQNRHELPVRTLLGETGFRFLLALDKQPEALHSYLAAKSPFGHRLGFYAESLAAFWFSHAPHCRLSAQNLQVCSEDGRTLGAADFFALINGKPYHVELTCKYYGSHSGKPEDMAGLNTRDRLTDKAEKLVRQLELLKTPQGQAALKQTGITHSDFQTASIIRGIGFSATGRPQRDTLLNPYGWSGLYMADWAGYKEQPSENKRYCLLQNTDYLAPARVPENRAVGHAEIVSAEQGLIAVLERRPDGFWHETARLMKRSGTGAADANSHD